MKLFPDFYLNKQKSSFFSYLQQISKIMKFKIFHFFLSFSVIFQKSMHHYFSTFYFYISFAVWILKQNKFFENLKIQYLLLQSTNFKKLGKTSLFFNEYVISIYQINRLDKLFQIKSISVLYLKKLKSSFFEFLQLKTKFLKFLFFQFFCIFQ